MFYPIQSSQLWGLDSIISMLQTRGLRFIQMHLLVWTHTAGEWETVLKPGLTPKSSFLNHLLFNILYYFSVSLASFVECELLSTCVLVESAQEQTAQLNWEIWGGPNGLCTRCEQGVGKAQKGGHCPRDLWGRDELLRLLGLKGPRAGNVTGTWGESYMERAAGLELWLPLRDTASLAAAPQKENGQISTPFTPIFCHCSPWPLLSKRHQRSHLCRPQVSLQEHKAEGRGESGSASGPTEDM